MSDLSQELEPFSRKSMRLNGYDYRQPGAYFITICTYRMKNLFGTINAGEMVLNRLGLLAQKEIHRLPNTYPHLEIFDDEFIIMPNHIHAIIWITGVGATEPVAQKSIKGLSPHSLGAIVGQYKSRVTKAINKMRKSPGEQVFQRNYYDRIIRNEKELLAVKKYITDNPQQWEEYSDMKRSAQYNNSDDPLGRPYKSNRHLLGGSDPSKLDHD